MVGVGRDLWPHSYSEKTSDNPGEPEGGKNRVSQRQASARVSLASEVRDITFWWKLLEGWIYLILHLVSVGSVQVHLVSIVRRVTSLTSIAKIPLASKARDGFLELQEMKNSIELTLQHVLPWLRDNQVVYQNCLKRSSPITTWTC